jgi:hypothetical protein
LFFWIGIWIAFAVVSADLPKDMKNMAIAVCMIGTFIWLITGLLLSHGAIRADQIDNFGMDLVNVNKEFAKEWRLECAEAERQRRAKRKRRRSRDDEDEGE